jgi:hypothetical protein
MIESMIRAVACFSVQGLQKGEQEARPGSLPELPRDIWGRAPVRVLDAKI